MLADDGSKIEFRREGNYADIQMDDAQAKRALQYEFYQLVSPSHLDIQVDGPNGTKIDKRILSCCEVAEPTDDRWSGESKENLIVLAELHDVQIKKNWKTERILAELRASIPKE